MTSMNKVFADLPVTIFEAMSQLARDNNAINLGQGFPDDPGPEDIRRAASDAVMDGYNQYPSMMGIPELRQAIAAHYGRWHKLTLDPMTEVMVTSGGTEALTSAILAVVVPLSSFDPKDIPGPGGKQVVFACRSGKRSVTASLAAQAAGLAYDKHLAGGMLAWKAAGLPTKTGG